MQGSCLCGSVVFEVTPPLRDAVACHCRQCRKVSGHYWAAASVPLVAFRVVRGERLAWYRSSPTATRGFCGVCGATLFWKPDGEDRMSFSAGALQGPTRLRVSEHIFIEDAGDYYAPDGPPPVPTPAPPMLRASCLCGGVRFTVPGPKGSGITACHCTQCRKLSGHYAASFDVDEAQLHFETNGTVAEYATVAGAQRGFCIACGSSLYFRDADGSLAVEAGAVDGPTGCSVIRHVFVADRGDYYTLDDGLPQYSGRE